MEDFLPIPVDRNDGEGGLTCFMNRTPHISCQEDDPLKKLTGSPEGRRGGRAKLSPSTRGPGKFATDPNILRQAPENEERWRVSKQHRADVWKCPNSCTKLRRSAFDGRTGHPTRRPTIAPSPSTRPPPITITVTAITTTTTITTTTPYGLGSAS